MSWEAGIVIALVSLTVLFFWQSFKFDDKGVHSLLKLFLYMLGWVGVVLLMGVLRLMVEFSADTAVGVIALLDMAWLMIIFVFIMIFLYWLLFFAWYWSYEKNKKFLRGRG